MIEVRDVNESKINVFSEVLIKAAKNLDEHDMHLWDIDNLKPEALLNECEMDDMKLCYENGKFVGVFMLEHGDKLFWPEDKSNFASIHKIALVPECRGKGYGRKLMSAAEQICISHDISLIRLNCGAFRYNLRKFYEGCGYKMIDRVFLYNSNQVRYQKKIYW